MDSVATQPDDTLYKSLSLSCSANGSCYVVMVAMIFLTSSSSCCFLVPCKALIIDLPDTMFA